MKRRPYTEAEVRAVAQWRLTGLTAAEIGARLGRSGQSVSNMVASLTARLRVYDNPAAARGTGTLSKPKADPRDDPRQQPKRRRCLGGCGKMFLSAWAGNRICRSCALQSVRRLDARFEGGSTGARK